MSMLRRFSVVMLLVGALAIGAAVLFTSIGRAYLDEQLDQAFDGPSDTGGCCSIAQTFTVGRAGQLTRIEVRGFHYQGEPTDLTAMIIGLDSNGVPRVSNKQPAVILASKTLRVNGIPASWISFSFDTPLNVTAGQRYGIHLSGDESRFTWQAHHFGGQNYPGGTSYYLYNLQDSGHDQLFRTYVSNEVEDNEPPTGSININDDDAFTNSTAATLKLTCSDAGAGCAEMAFSNNGSSFGPYEAVAESKSYTLPAGDGTKTVYVKFKDGDGNESIAYNDSIVLDTVAPSNVTGTPDRAANANGWYNAPVTVDFHGQDSGSGISSCTTNATYSGPDSGSASVPGTCTDHAGNNSNGSFALKYDATAPTNVMGTADRAPNANGWYNAPVTVDFSGQDATSGIAVCTLSANYSGPDSSSASVNGSCTDLAGNTTNGTFTLKYDATAPTNVTATPDRDPNANDWYNAPVTVDFTGQDATSGIATCTTDATYSGPDSSSANVPGSCTDHAGNTSNGSFALKYDATAPTGVVGIPDRSPNVNGWYNALVTVDFSGQDATSGIASCTTDLTYEGPDTSLASVPGSCTDLAGNTTSGFFELKYDATAPTGVAGTPDRAANANGWYNAPVTVDFSGADATSGIDECTLDATYSGPDSGSASVPGSCTDAAGNSTDGSFDLKYDATAPANVTGTPDRAANANGWYNAAVSVDFSGDDPTSGIASCTTGATYNGPDNDSASVSGSCTDLAGNTGNVSFALKYDATAPTLSYLGNRGTYQIDQTIQITCLVGDNLSGIIASTCHPISGPAHSFGVGTHSFSASVTDQAGNSVSAQTSFSVGVTAESLTSLTKDFSTDSRTTTVLSTSLARAQLYLARGQRVQAELHLAIYRVGVMLGIGKSFTAEEAAILIDLSRQL